MRKSRNRASTKLRRGPRNIKDIAPLECTWRERERNRSAVSFSVFCRAITSSFIAGLGAKLSACDEEHAIDALVCLAERADDGSSLIDRQVVAFERCGPEANPGAHKYESHDCGKKPPHCRGKSGSGKARRSFPCVPRWSLSWRLPLAFRGDSVRQIVLCGADFVQQLVEDFGR